MPEVDLTPNVTYLASTVTVNTSNTTITGLSRAVSTGLWRFKAYIPVVNAGPPTNVNFLLGASGTNPPTTSLLNYMVRRYTASTFMLAPLTAFNTAPTGSLVSIIGVIEGIMNVTVAGTLAFSAIRLGGTSTVVQIGAYSEVQRVG